MPQVPAFCDSCGLIFPSGIELVNSSDITKTGGQVSCPRCHSNGRVLDGVYDSLGDTIQALLKMSVDELKTLRASLERLREEQAPSEQIAHDLAMHSFLMSSFAYIVRKEPPKAMAIITLLCTIINTILGGYNAFHQKGITKEEVEAMIHKSIDAQSRPTPSPLQQPPTRNRAERRKAKHK